MVTVKLLLDTHTLIWWLIDAPKLSQSAKEAVSREENRIFVSSASAWEIATKFRIGKLPSVEHLMEDFAGHIRRERFEALSITFDHAKTAGLLPGPHRDPFDRLLIAQAQLESMCIVTNDPIIRDYGAAVVW